MWTAPGAAQSGLGDPTRPTPLSGARSAEAAPAEVGPRWRLHSTLVAADRRLAVINGQTVREGEMIEGARLVEVRPDGVRLAHNGRRVDLSLKHAEVKRPAAPRARIGDKER